MLILSSFVDVKEECCFHMTSSLKYTYYDYFVSLYNFSNLFVKKPRTYTICTVFFHFNLEKILKETLVNILDKRSHYYWNRRYIFLQKYIIKVIYIVTYLYN